MGDYGSEYGMARTILNLAEISQKTRIPVATLRYYRATADGKGPRTWKLGNKVVAFEDDVDAFIQAAYEAGVA